MDNKNGQTEKIGRRHENSRVESERASMESVRHYRSESGTNPIIPCGEDSDGRSTDWKLTPVRDTTAGKILERIESLEAHHIKYVRAHQSRLNARLEESIAEEEKFRQEANQIKSDIYHLATQQQVEQANRNGHIN